MAEHDSPDEDEYAEGPADGVTRPVLRRRRAPLGTSGREFRLSMIALLTGSILVGGAFAVYQFSRRPAAAPTSVAQPTPTTAIIVSEPDDEIIFHSTPAPDKPTEQLTQQSTQAAQPARVMYVSAKGSNVRYDASLTSPILMTLDRNTQVTDSGLRKSGNDISWAHIRLADGRQGWISEKLLTSTPVSTPAAVATARPQAPAPAIATADRAGIQARAEQWRAAWESRDLATVEVLMHNDFTGESMSKWAWLNKRKAEASRTRSRSIEWQDVQVRVTGNNAEVSAIQHYHDVFHDNRTYDSSVRIRLGLIRWSDGKWYIVRLRFAPA